MAERIGLNEFYEEYAIHDYELPFDIDEYTPIEEVNRLCEMVSDLPEYIQDNLKELQSYFGSIEEPVSYTHLTNRQGPATLRSRNPDVVWIFGFCGLCQNRASMSQ